MDSYFNQHKAMMEFTFFTIQILGLKKDVTYDIRISSFEW